MQKAFLAGLLAVAVSGAAWAGEVVVVTPGTTVYPYVTTPQPVYTYPQTVYTYPQVPQTVYAYPQVPQTVYTYPQTVVVPQPYNPYPYHVYPRHYRGYRYGGHPRRGGWGFSFGIR